MKFIDLFSGIGGFRLGMEMAGHECIGHVEIDKFANISYNAIHRPRKEEFFHDNITKLTDEHFRDIRDRGCEVICGGFPCQAFSIAGKRQGFEDTRGTLFFDIARMARVVKPKYLFLENVRGLLSHDSGNTFETILRTLDDLGYDTEWQMLNSKDFGVPQNRERVFIIGHSRGSGGRKVFPITSECQSVDGLQGQHVGTITTRTGESGSVGTYIVEGEQFSQDRQGVMVKEATKQGYAIAEPGDSINLEQPNSKTRRGRVGKGIAQTLTTSCNQATIVEDQRYIDGISDKYSFAKKKAQEMLDAKGFLPERFNPYNSQEVDEVSPTLTACCGRSATSSSVLMKQNNFRIRKLTPKECWRLQGFPDWAFERAKAAGVSDSQLYKQAGNSVTVNVIYEIAKKLK